MKSFFSLPLGIFYLSLTQMSKNDYRPSLFFFLFLFTGQQPKVSSGKLQCWHHCLVCADLTERFLTVVLLHHVTCWPSQSEPNLISSVGFKYNEMRFKCGPAAGQNVFTNQSREVKAYALGLRAKSNAIRTCWLVCIFTGVTPVPLKSR